MNTFKRKALAALAFLFLPIAALAAGAISLNGVTLCAEGGLLTFSPDGDLIIACNAAPVLPSPPTPPAPPVTTPPTPGPTADASNPFFAWKAEGLDLVQISIWKLGRPLTNAELTQALAAGYNALSRPTGGSTDAPPPIAGGVDLWAGQNWVADLGPKRTGTLPFTIPAGFSGPVGVHPGSGVEYGTAAAVILNPVGIAVWDSRISGPGGSFTGASGNYTAQLISLVDAPLTHATLMLSH